MNYVNSDVSILYEKLYWYFDIIGNVGFSGVAAPPHLCEQQPAGMEAGCMNFLGFCFAKT
jgi:hypothetical protein